MNDVRFAFQRASSTSRVLIVTRVERPLEGVAGRGTRSVRGGGVGGRNIGGAYV